MRSDRLGCGSKVSRRDAPPPASEVHGRADTGIVILDGAIG
jgi:hypothetical protein